MSVQVDLYVGVCRLILGFWTDSSSNLRSLHLPLFKGPANLSHVIPWPRLQLPAYCWAALHSETKQRKMGLRELSRYPWD